MFKQDNNYIIFLKLQLVCHLYSILNCKSCHSHKDYTKARSRHGTIFKKCVHGLMLSH